MNAAPLGRSTDSDDAESIRLEQARIIYSALPLSLAAILINASILAVVFWDTVPRQANLGWLAATYGVTLFRWMVLRGFRSAPNASRERPHWRRALGLGVVLSGILWGSASLFLFPDESMLHQLLLAFVIAGMSAGAVTTLSAIYGLAVAFLSLSLAPLIWCFAVAGNAIGDIMAVMTALFALMLIGSSKRLSQMILESLQTRHERRQAQETIRYQALYDELTDLPNRRQLLERLAQEMSRSKRHGHMGAVLFLDLDHFKKINDSLGHRVGDKVLQAVGARIRFRLRQEDIAARLGGDEFVVLIPEVGDTPDIAAANTEYFAFELRELFREPFVVGSHKLHLSASVGIALFPMEQEDPEDLLQQADVAMYRAKELGRDNVQLFLPSMQAAVDRRLEIERDLRWAIGNDELELYYQPQVIACGRLVGAEALVRWNHPSRGLISPADFIGIAEESGLIYQLGDWVLRRACEQLADLGRASQLHLSVNISPKQFREQNFVERVRKILAETGAPPELLTLEITESLVIDDIEQTVQRMRILKTLGLSFAMDDFGTGHSSLAYLKRLPLDTIKIDRSFVHDIESDPNDAVIVETIIVMSHHLGLEAIAEGVETHAALAFLRSKGCERFQGYLFGRPEPFGELLLRLVDGPPEARSSG
jgi:diguanylate cyclase (GGDEF)-like protein